MKKFLITTLLSSALLMPAYGFAAEGKDLAEVNGKPITQADVDNVLARLSSNKGLKQPLSYDSLQPKEKELVVREAAAKKLVSEEVKKSGIAKEEAIKTRLEQIEADLLQNEFLNHKAKESVTDTAVKARYDELVKQMTGKEEIHARHILVATEEEAKAIRAQLAKKPSSFAEVAKAKSKDTSAANGGDLGYFVPGTMVKEFETAAVALKKGEISQPVKTKFGWHIITVEDRRPVSIPKFEEVKNTIRQELMQKAVEKYVKSLLDNAKIELAK